MKIRGSFAAALWAVSASTAFGQGVTHDLVLWLRADVGITMQGGGIAAWADSSPAGHGAGQANGAQ